MGQTAEAVLSGPASLRSALSATVDQLVAAEPARYPTAVRAVAGIAVTIIASYLIINSMQLGAAFAYNVNGGNDWTPLIWGDHWAWRAAWGLVATYFAGFLGGLVARNRGTLVGVLGGLPSAAFWTLVAYSGWTGHLPNGGATDIPIGYRLAATLVAVVTLPLSGAAGQAGAGYGAANGSHFDSRRATLFGIKWYHYIWLPFLVHLLMLQWTWATMYGFGWLVASWQNGFSFFFSLPALAMSAMLVTLNMMGLGAFKAYEALAGFESDDKRSVSKRVLVYGFGYPLGAAAAQSVISVVHYGLSKLFA